MAEKRLPKGFVRRSNPLNAERLFQNHFSPFCQVTLLLFHFGYMLEPYKNIENILIFFLTISEISVKVHSEIRGKEGAFLVYPQSA